MTDTDYLLQRLREVRTIRVRGGGGRNAVLPPSEIDLEAATEIERLRAEVTKLRALAADAYQAAGAHDWPVEWLDALSAAASALPFSIDGLLPMATPELVARATRAESELAALRQAVWDARAILGFDNGGDPTPDALAQPTLAELVLRDAREFRKDYDEACDEAAALRGRIAAAPVVCIDNGACVTDGARLTIAGGDTYFAHAELCGKRVRLLIEPTSSDLPPSCVPVPDRSPGSSTR